MSADFDFTTPVSLPGSSPLPPLKSSWLYQSRLFATFGPRPMMTPPPRFKWASNRATWAALGAGTSHRMTQSAAVRSDSSASANSAKLIVRGRAGFSASRDLLGSSAVCKKSLARFSASGDAFPFTKIAEMLSRTCRASVRWSSAGSSSLSASLA